jgi:ParB-like chromosome segregation protein Spo0J
MAERRVDYLPLDEILGAARNPKRHAEAELRASIDRFGFGDLPLRDDRTGRLVAGHGRIGDLRARQDAGQSPPDGVRLADDGSWLVPVIVGWASRSDAEAEAYGVAANKLTEAGGWDEDALAELLSEMAEQDFDLALLTGFDSATLEEMLCAAEPAPEAYQTVPSTDARYAETQEEMDVRGERVGNYEPRQQSVAGFTELILIFTNDDRAEYDRLAGVARSYLGGELRSSELALRAMTALVESLEQESLAAAG